MGHVGRALDFFSIGPVDWRVQAHKIDPPLAAVFAYLVGRTMSGPWWLVLGEAVAAFTLLVALYRWRDRIEHAHGAYGADSRRVIRQWTRWTRWPGRGNRRVAAAAAAFVDAAAGIDPRLRQPLPPDGPERDALVSQFAAAMAAALRQVVVDALAPPLDVGGGTAVDVAQEADRAAAKARAKHHGVAVAHVVALLAAELTGAGRGAAAAARLKKAGQARAAADVTLLLQVLEALRADPQIADGHGTAPDRLCWRRRRSATSSQGTPGGAPRAGRHDARRARRDRAAGTDDRAAAGLPGVGAGVVAQHRSGAVERCSDDRPGTPTQPCRRDRHPGLSDDERANLTTAHAALHAAAVAVIEIVLDPKDRAVQRQAWREAQDLAIATGSPIGPDSALNVLLTVAGSDTPLSAAALAAWGGGAADVWQGLLDRLVAAGAIEGKATEGYKPNGDLGALWRAAPPQLRHALRGGATVLLGGGPVAPLLSDGTALQYTSAVDHLLDLLRDATRAQGPHDDGLWSELRSALALPAQRRYVRAEPAAAVGLATPVQDKRDLRKQHAAILARHVARAELAERLHLQAVRLDMARARDPRWAGPRGPPPAQPTMEDLTHAFIALKEAAAQATEALDAAGVQPHQRNAVLAPANRVLARRPGADLPAPGVRDLLRQARHDMDRARRKLRRAGTAALGDALQDARLALEEYLVHNDPAWERKLWRLASGWELVGGTWLAASRLQETIHARSGGTVPTATEPAAGLTELPDSRGGGVLAVDDRMAAGTRRGLGHPVNQDAITIGQLTAPDGALWDYVIAADGLSSGHRSEAASAAAVTAARAELRRAVAAGEDPGAATRAAFEAARAAVANLDRPDTPHPPATTLAVVVIVPGAAGTGVVVHIAWAGDTTVRWVPETGDTPKRPLARSDLRTGALTSWLAANNRPATRYIPVPLTGPGTLLVNTDGIETVTSIADVVRGVTDQAPQAVVEALLAASLSVQRADDRTVAAVRIADGAAPAGTTTAPPSPPSGSGPSGGPTAPSAPGRSGGRGGSATSGGPAVPGGRGGPAASGGRGGPATPGGPTAPRGPAAPGGPGGSTASGGPGGPTAQVRLPVARTGAVRHRTVQALRGTGRFTVALLRAPLTLWEARRARASDLRIARWREDAAAAALRAGTAPPLAAELVAAGLWERPGPGEMRYRPGPALAALLERTPRAFAELVMLDPVAALGDRLLRAETPAELIAAAHQGVWEVAWDTTAGERGPRARRVVLRVLFDPVRTDHRAVERAVQVALVAQHAVTAAQRRAAAEQRRDLARQRWAEAGGRARVLTAPGLALAVLRSRRAGTPLADATALAATAEATLLAAQQAERVATIAAVDAAVLARFTRKRVERERDRALLGWRRVIGPVLGVGGVWPGQVAGVPGMSSDAFAEHYGQTPQWVGEQNAASVAVTGLTGLAVAALSRHLIRTMVPIALLGVVGAAALAAIGLLQAAALFLPSMVLISVMGVGGGLMWGRAEIHHPVVAELKVTRKAQSETWAKLLRFVVPLVAVPSVTYAGVTATMVALTIVTLGLTAVVVLLLRGSSPLAREQGSSGRGAGIAGTVRQVLGTPFGLLRWVASIPVLTVLTGLYATALGAMMVDQVVRLDDPGRSEAAVAAIVTVIALLSRGASLAIGPSWRFVATLLGSPGAAARLFGHAGPAPPVQQARLLRAVNVVAVLVLVPAVWLVLAPGLVPLALLYVLGEVHAALARMPLNDWSEGPTGASLINAAKAGSIALGMVISTAMLTPHITAATERHAAGLDHLGAAHAGHVTMAVLALLVVTVVPAAAHLVAALRIGTLDELDEALRAAGATTEQVLQIGAKLSAVGLGDVGSVRALYLPVQRPHGWWPRWRSRALLARRAQVGLSLGELRRVLAAIRLITGGRPAQSPSVIERMHETSLRLMDRAEARLGAQPGADAADTLAGIRALRERLLQPGALLLGFDAEGRGHAIVAVGADLDRAQRFVVHVPGARHRLASLPPGLAQTEALLDSAARAGAVDTVAIAWWGYDMPQKVWSARRADSAAAAAPALAAFVAALAARGPPATVAAHSYGAVVAGLAARLHGMPATDLVVFGAPGTTAAHASELGLPDGHVWAAAAQLDPVPGLGGRWHGTDPVDPRFGARTIHAGTGGSLHPRRAHSSYFAPDSPALAGIGWVVAGIAPPFAVTGDLRRVGIRGEVVGLAAIRDAVTRPLTPPQLRTGPWGVGFRYTGRRATVVLDSYGRILAAAAAG